MKILIAGGTGLIGKELGKHLVQIGASVYVLTRDAERAKRELPFPAKVLTFNDLESPASAAGIALELQGLHAVINLMGENIADHRWTKEYKRRLIDSRVLSTRRLIKAFLHLGLPSVWIQGSAIGIYPESEPGQRFTETSATASSSFLQKLCVDWESETKSIESRVRLVTLRTGVVLSHRGGAFPKMIAPILQGFGGALGTGAQMVSLIHLDDVTRFIIHALKNNDVSGVVNLCSPNPLSQVEMTQKICAALGLKPGLPAPKLALKLMLGEMASLLLDSQAVVSERFDLFKFQFKYPDFDSMLGELRSWYLHPTKTNEACFIHYAEQFVQNPIDQVFPFFSDAKNLEKITPEWLNFKIKKISTDSVMQGTKIHYSLKLHGIPLGWETDIAEWNPPSSFVDNQAKGPYRLWYHRHGFEPLAGGTLLTDWVRFQLPMGRLGMWFGLPKVNSDVSAIFNYRKKVIESLF